MPHLPRSRSRSLSLLASTLVGLLALGCTVETVSTGSAGSAGSAAGSGGQKTGGSGGSAGQAVGGQTNGGAGNSPAGAGGTTAGSGGSGGSAAGQGGGGPAVSGEAAEAPGPYATEGIHVTTGGSDESGDGSAAAPYRTIQHALDSAAPGATVLVHAGKYDGPVRIRHSNLLLQAIEGEKVHIACPVSIDENDPPLCVEIDAETQGVRLRGLEVSGGFYAVYLGSQWDYDDTPLDNATARGVTIEDCILHDSGRDVVKLPAGCDNVTIRRCEIYNSGAGYPPGFPQEDKNAEGIDVVNSDNLRVADTYIHDTATTCVYVKGGSIGAVIERVRAERCGELGIALGFDTSPEFFDTTANPGYFENIGGTVRNCIVQDTGLAGIGLFASQNARVLHNTIRRAATRDQAALYLGVATQDYDPIAKRPANQNPTIVGNIIDQSGVESPRCFGIRYSVEDQLGVLSGLSGPITLRDNLYHAAGPCSFDDSRPDASLDAGDLAAWQAHAAGFDQGSTFQDPMLDPSAHLLPGSPAIDATGATEGVGYDIDRQARSAPYDLGADER